MRILLYTFTNSVATFGNYFLLLRRECLCLTIWAPESLHVVENYAVDFAVKNHFDILYAATGTK